jgi:hypothetical protein
MFVFYPDQYLTPSYRISPFRTSDIILNHRLPYNNAIEDFLNDKFKDSSFIYTINGREAINIALRIINPDANDVVTIFTTSGNKYISSCVTNEIEKFCRWSMQMLSETKIIFVNHEFGYPYVGLRNLKKFNLPIIEDCAASFFSDDKEQTIGRTGDYVIYSFPKMFPIQVGGLLVSKQQEMLIKYENLKSDMLRYTKNVLSYYISSKDQIISQRINNYSELKSRFVSLGLPERFELGDGVVPGVFMFRTDNYDFDLPGLKKHFWVHGIQSSVFYGEKAFYIPVHQSLNSLDLDYFYEVMKNYLENTQK